MNDQARPTSGLVAGKYELVRLIGQGGMGSVWEARHVSLGTRFAIKFIESEYSDSVEARSRFDKEAKAAATIQSKHAIQIFDHGVTEDGKPYIVMEMLVGEPLDKRLDRLGRMPLVDTARIIGQVSRALARAHERGIVHRDLKPENIFLVRSEDDDDEIAKVLDFGIAKMSGGIGGAPTGLTSSTKTGAVLGTPYYMSPEQARGLRALDHRTDVWSLGVIGYRCVLGALPFDGESIGDLLVKICTSPLPVPSQLAPHLGPGFDAWFVRALERDPARRFQTVLELADALGQVAGLAPMRSGLGTPSAYGPPPQHTPGGGFQSGHGTPRPSQSPYAGGPTPSGGVAGAAVTSSALSRSTADSKGGSGKWVALAVGAALLVVGSLGGTLAFLKSTKDADAVNGKTVLAPPEPNKAESPAADPAPHAAVDPARAEPTKPDPAKLEPKPEPARAETPDLPEPPRPAAGGKKPGTSRPTAAAPARPATPVATPATAAPAVTPEPAKKPPARDPKDPGY